MKRSTKLTIKVVKERNVFIKKCIYFSSNQLQCSFCISESNRALFLANYKSSAMRCFVDSAQKTEEDEKYDPIYSPTLRSNLTIRRTPSIIYEEPIVSKTGETSLQQYTDDKLHTHARL